MKMLVVYICVSKGRQSKYYAERFISSYHKFRPGFNHELLVVFNGQRPPTELQNAFAGYPKSSYIRDNSGFDIGAYQDVAEKWNPDLMLCLGESVYFHRPEWLLRLAEAYEQHGPGMYGLLSSYQLQPHLNTTAFACSPGLIRSYPLFAATKGDRYHFEHGAHALWRRVAAVGAYAVKFVTWDGEWDLEDWRKPDNILCRGDQSNLLAFCNHSDNFARAQGDTKRRLADLADGKIKVKTVAV